MLRRENPLKLAPNRAGGSQLILRDRLVVLRITVFSFLKKFIRSRTKYICISKVLVFGVMGTCEASQTYLGEGGDRIGTAG